MGHVYAAPGVAQISRQHPVSIVHMLSLIWLVDSSFLCVSDRELVSVGVTNFGPGRVLAV
jgi:hypothetical protein